MVQDVRQDIVRRPIPRRCVLDRLAHPQRPQRFRAAHPTMKDAARIPGRPALRNRFRLGGFDRLRYGIEIKKGGQKNPLPEVSGGRRPGRGTSTH